MAQKDQIRGLIGRLARIDAGEGWSGDLNPTQRSALDYLGRANRFSRSPSHVADFLGTTRGTMSQTLKSLVRKGYVAEKRSAADKRSISCELTPAGEQAASAPNPLLQSLDGFPSDDLEQVEQSLLKMLHKAISANGHKSFGLCRKCRHFQKKTRGGYCNLLELALRQPETEQICHEQVPK